jgi:hypothetical protein
MKADFSRLPFALAQTLDGVRWQQGRVQTDADLNLAAEIAALRRRELLQDVIGLSGVPAADAQAFQLAAADGAVRALAGRMWIDGLLIRALQDSTLALEPGRWLVYVEAWQRTLTALEEGELLEVALGGVDTVVGLRTAWRLRSVALPAAADLRCAAATMPLGEATTGRLAARAVPPPTPSDPCEVPAQGGYTGVENQLYRIEIHRSGSTTSGTAPTFKWSRENGSVITRWTAHSGNFLLVDSLGRDHTTGFHDVGYVELRHDDLTAALEPGPLVKVDRAEATEAGGRLEIAAADRPRLFAPPAGKNALLRRWDSALDAPAERPIASNTWFPLESNVEVRFRPGFYRSGDYWLVPARAFIGDYAGSIEWPQAGNQPADVDAHGEQRVYAKLGIVEVGSAPAGGVNRPVTLRDDCRQVFPPLTQVVDFDQVQGDGQSGRPDQTLACPLRVAVTLGRRPLRHRWVRFELAAPASGTLTALPNPGGSTPTGTSFELETDADGLAGVLWRLPDDFAEQTCLAVKASLLVAKAGEVATPPVFFNARLERGGGSEPGIRIEKVTIGRPEREFVNDDSYPVPLLIGGLTFHCDRRIADVFQRATGNRFSPARPILEVSVAMPFATTVPGTTSLPFGYQEVVLDAVIEVDENQIRWLPHDQAPKFLQSVLSGDQMPVDELLFKVRLHGNFVWAEDDPNLFLDAEAFGFRRDDLIEARLPSGDQRRGGALHLWFWGRRPQMFLNLNATNALLTVRVLDDRGAPLPDVDLSWLGPVPGAGRTDANGLLSATIRPGTYTVTARKTGFEGVVETVVASLRPVDPPRPTDPVRPVDPRPIEPRPVDPRPIDPRPLEPRPVDPRPIDPRPLEPRPIDPIVPDRPLRPIRPTPIEGPAGRGRTAAAPLTEVAGIGAALAARLREAGIADAAALAAATPERIAEVLGVRPERAAAIREAAAAVGGSDR